MFGFFKKERPPAQHRSNPGAGVDVTVDFSAGGRTWTERANIVRAASGALRAAGYSIRDHKSWLHHAESGFTVLPLFVDMEILPNGGVKTTTSVQCNHPVLTPQGIFEYQHSTGDTLADSLTKGFSQWAQMDFLTLLESLESKPKSLTTMEWTFPAAEGTQRRNRRAVLGPISWFTHSPPTPERTDGEEHSFCPCCLLTHSYDAFREYVEGNDYCGLRLFATRDADGTPGADCRINGEDWEPGAQALREYASTWPPAGYEFRKQYVVLQTSAAT